MDFTEWLWLKLIGGAVIIGTVSFLYAFFTGKTTEEARRENREKKARQPHSRCTVSLFSSTWRLTGAGVMAFSV